MIVSYLPNATTDDKLNKNFPVPFKEPSKWFQEEFDEFEVTEQSRT
jgi:hypothetical protein